MTARAPGIAREIERLGLLLLQDKSLPNVVSLVTGETVRGSWWAHPRAHEIFGVLTELGDHPDVLFCKLVAGKQTLVHRRLWPSFLAVATSRGAWQTKGLSAPARKLWKRLAREKEVVAAGDPVRELERRLLVVAREVHTDSGAHRMVVETWQRWAERNGGGGRLTAEEGKRRIELSAAALGAPASLLPWAR